MDGSRLATLFVGWEPWAWTLECPDTVRPSHLSPYVPRDSGTAGSISSPCCCGQDNISRMIVVTQRRPSRCPTGLWRPSGGVDGRNDMIHGSMDGERPSACSTREGSGLGVGRGRRADADAARSDSRHQHGGMRTMLAVDTMIECASLEMVTGGAASVATAAAAADK